MIKIPVFLYLYHLDLWPEFFNLLYPLRNKIILNLALCKDHNTKEVENNCISNFKNCKISFHPNAGVDILPFLHQLIQYKGKADFFLKLHSKKSHFCKKLNWRSVFLQSLIGSKKIFLSNTKQFDKKEIGIVSNKIFSSYSGENNNGDKIKELCDFLEINYNKYKNSKFVAGNMFFGRFSLFNKYFNEKTIDFFENKLMGEKGRVTEYKGSTYSHSLERIFGYLAKKENYKINYCYEQTVKILNSKGPKNKLHLVKQYDNQCYIQENVCVYGRILSETNKKINIEWHHQKEIVKREYLKLSKNCLAGK
jgi:hypothetical protein